MCIETLVTKKRMKAEKPLSLPVSCTQNDQLGENLFMIMYIYTLLIVPKYRQ